MPPNDESRSPSKETGPATITNQGHHNHRRRQTSSFLPADRPVENVLDRLEGVRRSPRGWTAKCPAHEDRHASLSVAEGRDGRALVNCFAACGAEEIVRAVGLELRDLFAPREDRRPPRPRPRARPVTLPAPTARVLVESNEFAKAWTIAKALAELTPRQQRVDVLASWDFLSNNVDIPVVLELAALVRGTAFFRYCTSARCEDADVARAVRRLVEAVETDG